jgi:hypothetical protein
MDRTRMRQNKKFSPWLVAVRESGAMEDRIAVVFASTPREALAKSPSSVRRGAGTARVYGKHLVERFQLGKAR